MQTFQLPHEGNSLLAFSERQYDRHHGRRPKHMVAHFGSYSVTYDRDDDGSIGDIHDVLISKAHAEKIKLRDVPFECLEQAFKAMGMEWKDFINVLKGEEEV